MIRVHAAVEKNTKIAMADKVKLRWNRPTTLKGHLKSLFQTYRAPRGGRLLLFKA